MFDGINSINDDSALLGLWGKQLLIEPIHGVLAILHDFPGVIVLAYNPHASCLGMLILDERSLPCHIIYGLSHG
jgi:hypothetical protein